MGWATRGLSAVVGIVILYLTSSEILRTGWPSGLMGLLTVFCPIAAAAAMIGGALLWPAELWQVSPGHIIISRKTPFSLREFRLELDQIDEIRLIEDSEGGDTSYSVLLIAKDRTHYKGRPLKSYEAATKLREDIKTVLYAEAQ